MIFKRITNVWRAVLGTQLTELETDNAEAMLELEREQLHRQVARYNSGLAGHAAMCARLESQIERLDKEHADLSIRVATQLELGKREQAGRHALRLEALELQRIELCDQREQAEATYQDLVRSRDVAIEAAREKIASLKRTIGDFRVQEALAELTEMASRMHGQIGIGDGTMDRIKERIEDRRDFAVGRVRVARGSIDLGAVEQREAEQHALARLALERFEASTTPSSDGS